MAGEEFSERRISEFNEAAFQIQRLHSIWVECKTRRQNGDLYGLRYSLDTAAIELWVDAVKIDERNKDIEKGYQKKIGEIDQEIDEAIEKKDVTSLKILYKLFTKKEKILRQLQEDAGKGGKSKLEDDDFSI